MATYRIGNVDHIYATAYWTACSHSTKNKLRDFFTNKMGYKEDATPIIIHGARPFSLYKYYTDTKYDSIELFVLVISRQGIKKIQALCTDVKSDTDILNRILLYLNSSIKDNYPNELKVIKRMLPYIVKHYVEYRDHFVYDSDKCTGRYLCFVHHPSHRITTSISMFLNDIAYSGEDADMIKSKITYW